MQLSEQKEEFERLIALGEQKVAAAKSAAAKRDEENAIAVRLAREEAARAAEERDAAQEGLRSLRLEMDAVRSAAVEQEHRLLAELQALKRRYAQAVPFDDARDASLLCWDRNAEFGARARDEAAEHLRRINRAIPQLSRPPSFAEIQNTHRRIAELTDQLAAAESRATALLAQVETLHTQLDEAKRRPSLEAERLRSELQQVQKQLDDSRRQQQKLSEEVRELRSARSQLVDARQQTTASQEEERLREELRLTQTQLLDAQRLLQQQQQQQQQQALVAIQTTPKPSPPASPPVPQGSDEKGYTLRVELTGAEERKREQQIQEHYEATIAHIVAKAHKADDRAQELQRECDALRAEMAALSSKERALAAELANTRDDLDSTRRAYDTQIQAMSEHAAGLSESLAMLDNELTSARGCRVRCATCKTWNTVGFLLTDGLGGKLCSGGSHPTLTFMR